MAHQPLYQPGRGDVYGEISIYHGSVSSSRDALLCSHCKHFNTPTPLERFRALLPTSAWPFRAHQHWWASMRVKYLPTLNKLSRPAFQLRSLPTRLRRCPKRRNWRAASSQQEEELANQDLSAPKAIENLLVPEATKDASMHATETTSTTGTSSKQPMQDSCEVAAFKSYITGNTFIGSGTEDSNLAKFGALLVLLSPFFFWGTSMVAMKASSLISLPIVSMHILPLSCAALTTCQRCRHFPLTQLRCL